MKIINSSHPILKRWPKSTPFNFEKNYFDTFVLPYKLGVPKFELFAAIDDDNLYRGSSLIKRGLYPSRVGRDELLQLRSDDMKNDIKFIAVKKIPSSFIFRKLINFWNRILYTIQ